MEPRQQHGGLGPRPGLRSPMGDVPSCQDRQAPWVVGQDSTSSGAVAQQGVEDSREPLCSTGQAMCLSPQDTTLESLSHPRAPQQWGG